MNGLRAMEINFQQLQEKINNNKEFRKELAKSSLIWFAKIYFSKYLFYKTAPFQKEIYVILQDDDNDLLDEIIAHRGSAKTTMAMLFYPIWAMITGRKHHIILISDTFSQVKDHIYNLKNELENNARLKKDFGPFDVKMETQKKEEWQKSSMIIPNYDVKIVGKSTGQRIRGTRYKQYRPDVLVIDDIEDLEMVRTKEQRDKTHRWFTGSVIPAGEKDRTKKVLIGNLLHKDAIMNRIKKEIQEGKRNGRVFEFPIMDSKGEILWKGKYPDMKAIEAEKKNVSGGTMIGMRAWQREYMLKLVPEEGQIIKDEWIQYYDSVPDDIIVFRGTGVDLAISKKASADYTAMVSGKLAEEKEKPKVYVMPNPVNERLSGFETTERARRVSLGLGDNENLTPLWVEDVAYQRMQVEAMIKAGLPATSIKVSTDKRARLMTISSYVENGTVVFPRKGCEDLLLQLTGFGVEAHDDLVDAFVYMVQGLMNQYGQTVKLEWL